MFVSIQKNKRQTIGEATSMTNEKYKHLLLSVKNTISRNQALKLGEGKRGYLGNELIARKNVWKENKIEF